MTVKTIDEENIVGSSKGRRVTVALSDVDSMKYRDPSIGKSIGAGATIVGTAILLYLVIVLLRLPF